MPIIVRPSEQDDLWNAERRGQHFGTYPDKWQAIAAAAHVAQSASELGQKPELYIEVTEGILRLVAATSE